MGRITVEPVVFLYNFADTIQMSVQQDFIFYRLCSQDYSKEVCQKFQGPEMAGKFSQVQMEAVKRVMWISVITGIIAVITSQILGFALDKYSRKIIMLIPFLGSLGLNLVCVVVAASPTISIDILYLGAVVRGLAGGYVVFKSSVSSYVVNLASLDERTNRLAMVESMLYLGSAAGPLCLQLLDDYGTQKHAYLFLSCECIVILALIYIVVFIPDYTVLSQSICSISNEVESDLNENVVQVVGDVYLSKRCSFFKDYSNAFAVTFQKREAGIRGAIIMLFFADFFIAIVYAAEFDLLYLYMQDKLGFTLPQYSQYLAVKNLVNWVSLLFLLPLLRKWFRLHDTTLGVLGGLSRNAAFFFLAFNTSHDLVYLVPFLDIFGQYLFVVLRSIISGLVRENEQGRVLTVMSSMAQLSLLIGSAIFDSVYPKFLSQNQPGFTFVLAAISMGMSATILSIIQCHLMCVRRRED